MRFLRRMLQLGASYVAVALLAVMAGSNIAVAVMAPDANSVLILGPTVTGGLGSVEATKAVALGKTPVVVDAATWGAMTAAEFDSYRALVFGDPTCITTPAPLAAAEANRAVWGPVVTGNKIAIGTDPVYHKLVGGSQLTESGIKFASDEPTETGMYMTLSCYYYTAASGTPVPVLDVFGTFKVVGQGGCPADSHIVAVHPALSGSTDATLSFWGCSTHEGFTDWPSDWLVLAISKDVPSTFIAPDGTSGAPYIIAQGKTLSPILCGNGALDGSEECDDGNTTNGDGCSAQCKIENLCGNGALNPPEECDDGNNTNGDGCSSICENENTEPGCGQAVLTKSLLWPPNHTMHNIAVVGVTDPDGDPVTVTIMSVMQDEPLDSLGDGNTEPDAALQSDGSANVRAERTGTKGDGRVYIIGFEASDGAGGSCTGERTVCVPHDVKDGCVESSPLYNSLY